MESRTIGRYIRDHSEPNETVAVLGSEPEIYFYSHRRSATSHIYVFALTEAHENVMAMQEEFTRQIDQANPRYIVLIPSAWAFRQVSVQYVFDWFSKVMPRYEEVGMIDIDKDGSKYRWDKELGDGRPASQDYIVVLRRK